MKEPRMPDKHMSTRGTSTYQLSQSLSKGKMGPVLPILVKTHHACQYTKWTSHLWARYVNGQIVSILGFIPTPSFNR